MAVGVLMPKAGITVEECMITHWDKKVGDLVKIVSDDDSNPNSVSRIAKLMNTIPYEFLVKLQASIRRKII